MASGRWESIKSDPRFNTSAQWLPEGFPGPEKTPETVHKEVLEVFFFFPHSHKAKGSPTVRSLGPAISIRNLVLNFKLQDPWHPFILIYLRTSDFNLLSKNWGPRPTASFSSPETSATFHASKWTEVKVASGPFSSLAFREHRKQSNDALNRKLRVQPCGKTCQSIYLGAGRASIRTASVCAGLCTPSDSCRCCRWWSSSAWCQACTPPTGTPGGLSEDDRTDARLGDGNSVGPRFPLKDALHFGLFSVFLKFLFDTLCLPTCPHYYLESPWWPF